MNPYHWKSIWLRLVIAITIISSSFMAVVVIGGWAFLDRAGVFEPDQHLLAKITNHKIRSNTVVVSRDSEKIGEFYETDLAFTPFEKIPQIIVDAIVAIEDRNFWRHGGFDSKGILRAAIANITGGRTTQGASTITQQLIKAFILGNERTLSRKAREVFLAVKLEKQLTKHRIFELYANEMFLGNGAYGIAAAAKRYFSKNLDQLTTAETALIAGLFQSPSGYNPLKYPDRAKRRQRQVLQALYRTGKISATDYQKSANEHLNYRPWPVSLTSTIAPWFLDHIKEEAERIIGRDPRNEGLTIQTTLSVDLQKKANLAVAHAAQNLSRYEHDQPLEMALLALDHHDGGIVAMTGGRNYAVSQFNRTTQAKRQPGSAFKTFVYALALKQGWTWADRIFVDPVKIDDYEPKNMTDEFFTETTMLRAFYKSINTPAVEVAHKAGLGNLLQFATDLGIKTPLKRELGTALGGSSVTMLDMATAYSTIANNGIQSDPHAILQITDRYGRVIYRRGHTETETTRPIDDATAWLVTEGLRSVMRHGTGASRAHLAKHAVGKTGTSNNGVDSWFVGYTGNLSIAVWAGRDDHGAIPRATGSAIALPAWAEFVQLTLSDPKWSAKLQQPQGITTVTVDPYYGKPTRSGVTMAFIDGTEPMNSRLSKRLNATPDELDSRPDAEIPDVFER